MQTNFTPQQLADPRIAEVDKILRRCVHCGLCTATCSTYVLLGDERDSPRGRIYLMRAVVDGRLELTPAVQGHLDSCLDCRSCETACPTDFLSIRVYLGDETSRSMGLSY